MTDQPREDEPMFSPIDRTSPAEAAFAALARALDDEAPGCKGDARFTLDAHELTREQVNALSVRVCAPCPLRDLCDAYGQLARPKAGVWAGQVYGPRKAPAGTA